MAVVDLGPHRSQIPSHRRGVGEGEGVGNPFNNIVSVCLSVNAIISALSCGVKITTTRSSLGLLSTLDDQSCSS